MISRNGHPTGGASGSVVDDQTITAGQRRCDAALHQGHRGLVPARIPCESSRGHEIRRPWQSGQSVPCLLGDDARLGRSPACSTKALRGEQGEESSFAQRLEGRLGCEHLLGGIPQQFHLRCVRQLGLLWVRPDPGRHVPIMTSISISSRSRNPVSGRHRRRD